MVLGDKVNDYVIESLDASVVDSLDALKSVSQYASVSLDFAAATNDFKKNNCSFEYQGVEVYLDRKNSN